MPFALFDELLDLGNRGAVSSTEFLMQWTASEQKAISEWLKTQGVRIVSKKSSMNIRDRAAYHNGKAKANGVGLDTQVNSATRSRMLGR